MRLERGDLRLALGMGDGGFEIAHQMAEEAFVHRRRRGEQRGHLRLDRIAFGQRRLELRARAVQLAAIDPAELHRQRVAHDLEADADQEAPPLERREIVERHLRCQRHAGQGRDLVAPDIDRLALRDLRRAGGLSGGRILLRQGRLGGRHGGFQRSGTGGDGRLETHRDTPRSVVTAGLYRGAVKVPSSAQ